MWKIIVGSVVTSTVVGMTWYSPKVFGKLWVQYEHPGKTFEDLEKDSKETCLRAMAITTVTNVAYTAASVLVLRAVVKDSGDIKACLKTGALLSGILCFSAVPHYVYPNRPLGLFLINTGYDTLRALTVSALYHHFG